MPEGIISITSEIHPCPLCFLIICPIGYCASQKDEPDKKICWKKRRYTQKSPKGAIMQSTYEYKLAHGKRDT